jgi:hypothetical protein
MLIGNAIRLQTFSLVNLAARDPRGFLDINFFASWLLSLAFSAGFLSVAIYNLYLVEKANSSENGLELLAEQNPVVEALFIGLKDTKQAKRFWSYFILRRFLIASIAVFLKGNQTF